ncbi:MAG: AAA family ATPase [Deltaproteobacteria bacterium]|nr:AAA family ATPase [Deltaproteobacteria bacterium]
MPLSGKQVALTGSLDGLNRADFRKLVEERGGTYALKVEEGLTWLVVGDKPMTRRVEQATELGVEVLDGETFLARVASPGPAQEEVPLALPDRGDLPLAVASLARDTVRLLDLALPVGRSARAPSMASFAHYTLDTPTLSMLRAIGRAVKLGQPCLLEGETATSKTSAILYLAALTGHEVVRINLNGQSDTSELVGRYVPNDEQVRLPVQELLQHLDLLEDESRMILERAQAGHRLLTGVERQQIAANERIATPQWRFQEGLIPLAMRHGWWVILDEVNLAEPAVLERLNPVLERQPSLVLTEGPGTRFGQGGDVPVHPEFRVFATMNPAEYQGRSVLSPAYKDRWVASWQAGSPGEAEYRQMLERLVFGRQPDVEVEGALWRGAEGEGALYGGLAALPGISGFLSRLAALHAGLVRMATPEDGKPPAIGLSRRERYVFSRRSLLAVLDGLGLLELCDPYTGEPRTLEDAPERLAADAIRHAYLDRIRGDEDRAKVSQLLRTLGMNPAEWTPQFTEDR